MPNAFCFTGNGTGWAAARRGNRLALLVTTDGGEHWAVTLAPDLLPAAGTRKAQGKTLPGAELELAACSGGSARAIVYQPSGQGGMQGVPYTFDLLETSDMGAHWLDVLQSTGSDLVTRPRLPSPSSGPHQAVAAFDGWVPQSALSTAPGALWLTSYNEDFGGITFASTGDAGLQWSQTAYPGQRPGAKSLLPPSGWTSTAASGPAVAWAVFTGQRNEAGVEDSALYATHDTGAHWRLAKVFSWPPAEG